MSDHAAEPKAARLWDYIDSETYLARTVFEPEPQAPRFTGLLDANGNRLFRVEQPKPIGFVRWS